MKKSSFVNRSSVRLVLLAACLLALAVAFAVSLPQPVQADNITPPPVPTDLQVPEGSKAFLVGHAVGTQNYVCLYSGTAFTWAFYGPQATLFNDRGEQITTHFLSLNPAETETARATWQHSHDTSAVWVVAVASSIDSDYVAPGAIPWLKLQVLHTEAGPDGGDKLTTTTWIQRLNTTGGVAPTTGCSASNNIGNKAFVPYTADYYFYKGK